MRISSLFACSFLFLLLGSPSANAAAQGKTLQRPQAQGDVSAGSTLQEVLTPQQTLFRIANSGRVLLQQLQQIQTPEFQSKLALQAQAPHLAPLKGVGTLITFDEVLAPTTFISTLPLSGNYLNQATFGGGSDIDGGAILNVFSNFGIPPLSGDNFFAFNKVATYSTLGKAIVPERIFFGTGHSQVSVNIGSGSNPGYPVAVVAFNSKGRLQDVRIVLTTTNWKSYTLTGNDLSGLLILGDPQTLVVDDIDVQ